MSRFIVVIVLSVVLVGAVCAANAAELKAGVFSPARPAPDFTLQGSDGSELKLGRFRGKVVILGFGFTSCTEVCPVTLSVVARARKKLDAQGDQVQVIYITVDSQRDDVARLREYLATFDSTFIGGTGDDAQLSEVRQEYGIVASKKLAGPSYTFAHSSYSYLIDRQGKLRALMPFGRTVDDFVHDLQILLSE